MRRERFEELAEAFGGRVARWPAAEQDAAEALVAAEPDFTKGVLLTADGLDAALDAWPAPSVTTTLRDAVLSSAPVPRRRPKVRRWVWALGGGAGLAGACAAGLILGVTVYGGSVADNLEPISAAMATYDPSSGTSDRI